MEPLVINLGNKVYTVLSKAKTILKFQQMAENTYIPPKTFEINLKENSPNGF